MRYEEVINDRRSARGYLDKPVPKAVLEEVIKLATRAPSSMNTQPWHFHVITGTALDNIRKENKKEMLRVFRRLEKLDRPWVIRACIEKDK